MLSKKDRGEGPKIPRHDKQMPGLGIAVLLLFLPLALPGMEIFGQLVFPGLIACSLGLLSMGMALTGLVIILAAGSALTIIMGHTMGLGWLFQAAGLAAVLIIAKGKNWAGTQTLVAGLALLTFVFLISLTLGTGTGLSEAYHKLVGSISQDFDRGLAAYKEGSPFDAAALDAWFAEFKNLVIRLLPGLLSIVFLFSALTNMMTARICFRKRWHYSPFGPDFTDWRFPEGLIWGVIAGGGISLFGYGIWKQAGDNLLLFLGAVYFLQGLAIMGYLFRHLKVPVYLKWFTYILLGIQWYGLLGISILGLLDTWFDFRKRIRKLGQKDEEQG